MLFPDENLQRFKVGAANESLLLDSSYAPWLGEHLAAMKTGLKDAYLFDTSREAFKKSWEMALDRADLAAFHYVPYQLRHGGPSHDRRHGLRSQLEVKCRGRWASDANMRRYEAHARVQREFLRAPPAVRAAAEAAVLRLPALLRAARKPARRRAASPARPPAKARRLAAAAARPAH